MDTEVEVVFTPAGRRGHFPRGTTVLEAARRLAVDLDSVCGGRGICGRCQVTVGANPTTGVGQLSAPDETETGYAGRRPLVPGRRLGCAARIVSTVVIDVPPDSQVHRQVIRKRAGVASLPVDPVVRLHYVEVPEPELASPTGDAERLLGALRDEWALEELILDPALLPSLQHTLREGRWTVTAAVREGRRLIGLWPGYHDIALGVAFDVGSTTLAGHLCDLHTGAVLASHGVVNPQIRYGEDVMSRVSYVMMNPGGRERLTSAVREALDVLVGELIADSAVDRLDILEVTVVGNPIMHHLVLGIDPSQLGTAPFALATTGPVSLAAVDLGLEVHPGARLYALPCIAGHVGADTVGAALSEGPHRGEALQMLVDVGTNAEIILGNRERVVAASSPTGPAFEGAEISAGQRAAPGAIERVRIDRSTLEPRLRVIGSELWSDDPGFAESLPKSGITGICGSGIIEAVAEMFLAGVLTADGTITPSDDHPRITPEGRTWRFRLCDDPKIHVTQADVRAIQLAKAALQAGCRLLMDHLGVSEVDEIRLAGAFGSQIDPLHALVLGMIPDCDPDRVTAAGNAAGTGAMMALLSVRARGEAEDLARRVEKVETATEAGFQAQFVAAMGFPSTRYPYPRLAKRVELPTATAAAGRGRNRGRRSERSVR